ncbi:MAG TPA: FtsX-like permease family protein [Tenuifilaceae bacterium]|nr:FtsX-like permease family protein [Tenuifilaceae bacterium]HPE17321.1 FtsX-like permease family protein [Tenuifilaceae bacterium]HPJ44547.1 FtsX-like permease family protein [Tenuifilaceae bacterium]HPQ33085.1 FtsX-like permease family protein [Tenuifilaceae bacterium]HRX67629.1 FtsX-like permease family protein [Tenuifilaceae bacterium]
MIKFLIKGLFRDKSRSRLPIIVVSIGVMLTVLMNAYVRGFMGDTIEVNSKFTNGHLKVMSRAYAEEANQIPNDLALTEVSSLLTELRAEYPEVEWAPRIQFGGLVDVPDVNGETRSQGPAIGMGVDLLSENSKEIERLNLTNSIVRGSMIAKQGEVLLSEEFSQKLGINPGEVVTLIGSSMFGSMTMYNFTVSGTVRFGAEVIDRGAIITDIEDARLALDMNDAASEILGFLKTDFYDDERVVKLVTEMNEKYADSSDEFAPVFKSLSQQGAMGQYVALVNVWSIYIPMVFVFAMSLVLWNAGLLGGLRRYGEVGIRIAMGEEKGHVYRTMIYESIFIGIAGSIFGTAFGLFFAWLIQTYGIDISGMMEGASMMLPSVIRARITPADFYIGFFPGLMSTVIGTMLSGVGIYKRQTARLFKELES